MGNRGARRTCAGWLVLGVMAIGGVASVMASPAGADACVVTTVVCGTTTTSMPPTSTTVAPVPDAMRARAQLLALVNRERVQRGLAPVVARDDVEGIASGWSDAMAAAGAISHDDAYFTADSHDRLGAVIVAENVAQAVDIDQAHAALMASEHHRDNILDARFTVIGIGATYRDGWWWITQDFLQPRVAAPVARPMPAERARTVVPATSPSSTTPVAVVQALAASVATPAVVTPAPHAIVLPRVDTARRVVARAGDDGEDGFPRSTVAAVALVVGVLLVGRLRRPRTPTT